MDTRVIILYKFLLSQDQMEQQLLSPFHVNLYQKWNNCRYVYSFVLLNLKTNHLIVGIYILLRDYLLTSKLYHILVDVLGNCQCPL